jgi:predicted metal-dependent hydrolase
MKWSTNGSLSPAARLKRRVDVWAVKLRVMPRIIRVQRMTRKWIVFDSRHDHAGDRPRR